MSLIAGKLIGLTTLVPVSGIGVSYPIINSLKSTSQEFKLDNLNDFKNNCWVSMVGGDKGQYSGQNRKLLVCPSGNNSTVAKFYLYNENSEISKESPKEIKGMKDGEDPRDITLTFKNQETEVIGVSNTYWKFLYDKDLNGVCSIIKEDEDYRLSCAGHSVSTRLTKFNDSSGSELNLEN